MNNRFEKYINPEEEERINQLQEIEQKIHKLTKEKEELQQNPISRFGKYINPGEKIKATRIQEIEQEIHKLTKEKEELQQKMQE